MFFMVIPPDFCSKVFQKMTQKSSFYGMFFQQLSPFIMVGTMVRQTTLCNVNKNVSQHELFHLQNNSYARHIPKKVPISLRYEPCTYTLLYTIVFYMSIYFA